MKRSWTARDAATPRHIGAPNRSEPL